MGRVEFPYEKRTDLEYIEIIELQIYTILTKNPFISS